MEWTDIILKEISKPKYDGLKSKLKEERKTKSILPSPDKTFLAFALCKYARTRIVIIGQDPYPSKTHANGLAFSSCNTNERPQSLNNIYKEIINEYNGYYDFTMFPSNDLTCWAQQGILLFNTMLTVEEAKSGSHAGFGWEMFTEFMFQQLNSYPKPLVFMLWGNYAKNYKIYINNSIHLVLESAHPSPLSVNKGFFGNGHFKKAYDFLDKSNRFPIYALHFDGKEKKAENKLLIESKNHGTITERELRCCMDNNIEYIGNGGIIYYKDAINWTTEKRLN